MLEKCCLIFVLVLLLNALFLIFRPKRMDLVGCPGIVLSRGRFFLYTIPQIRSLDSPVVPQAMANPLHNRGADRQIVQQE
jgi:hypothetical protein